jgi:asparagine synthase (glutamine-hydrolysing)
MCGITGYCDYRGESRRQGSDRAGLERMTRVLRHRGPDDEGYYSGEFGGTQVGLGHRRLSVIDLSELGHQPMDSDDGDHAIVLNGEIYNYREIAAELEAQGFRFRSTSDTEVVLKALIHWGPRAVEKFVGMFALAFLDKASRRLFLFRDRAGIKPLYYYWHDGLFLFASELKSFHEHPGFSRALNHGAMQRFLRYQFIPAPHTIFHHTYKLRPGHFMEIDLQSRSVSETPYWSVLDAYNAPKLDIDEQEAVERLEALLVSAFEYRMVADVPVGVFLSGGYDSATVAALLQSRMSNKLRTFTIGFAQQGFDEAPEARALAEYLGTDHVEHYCTADDAAGIITTLPDIYDEPFADPSAIPTILVSRIAREHVTVALSADGGDETFAGYSKYTRNLGLFRKLAAVPAPLARALRPLVRPASKLPWVRDRFNIEARIDLAEGVFGERDRRALYRHKIEPNYCTRADLQRILLDPVVDLPTAYDNFGELAATNDETSRMLAIDYQTYMVDNVLVKVDRASMSVSLEGRAPLLDQIRNGTQKYLLRKLLHKHVPPKMMERPKRGFGAPIESWFAKELSTLLGDHLNESRLKADGLFDPVAVTRMRDDYLSEGRLKFDRAWTVLMFQMWKDRWL